MQSFQAFYTKVYKAEDKVDLSSINSFLENLPILTIGKDHKDPMEAPIATEEVLDVIKNLKRGSTPCLEGFSVPYYKIFCRYPGPISNQG